MDGRGGGQHTGRAEELDEEMKGVHTAQMKAEEVLFFFFLNRDDR